MLTNACKALAKHWLSRHHPTFGAAYILDEVFIWASGVMNIEWDYTYYQPWSDNEWLVDEMLAMLDEDVTMQ